MPVQEGDLTQCKGILFHGCNAQGVMGAGVALALKKKWPEVFMAYRQLYQEQGNQLKLGQVAWAHPEEGIWVANGITQQYYGRELRRYADLKAIKHSAQIVARKARETQLPVFYSLIGCGLGGLLWEEVEPILNEAFEGLTHCGMDLSRPVGRKIGVCR